MNEFVRRAYDEVADEYLLARRDDRQDLPLVDALIGHLPPGAAAKGVTITHRNIRSYIDWAAQYFSTRPDDRVLGLRCRAAAVLHWD